jgi:hypothetical protein
VAHPHLVPLADLPQPVEQLALLGHGEERAAELAALRRSRARAEPRRRAGGS